MSTDTQGNNNNVMPFVNSATPIETSAYAFLLAHRAEHLGSTDGLLRLRQRCAEHLMARHDVSVDRGLEHAARLLAELTHSGDAWIDIDASTSFNLVLRVGNQHNISFSADQLLDAVKNYYKLAI
ncbi:MAG: hypothetical protein AB9Q19_12640 [Candidatus Reddybacter sp.]